MASVYGTEGQRFESSRARLKTRMDAGFSPLLTFDLEGRRSNLAGGGVKRFSVLRRRRLDFLATFLATSAVGSPAVGDRSCSMTGSAATAKADRVEDVGLT
jgi:hypothetical protein